MLAGRTQQQEPPMQGARKRFGTAGQSTAPKREASPFTPFSKRPLLQRQKARREVPVVDAVLIALGLTLVTVVFRLLI